MENDPAIAQYLLGALPEAEGQRLDELSVIDDEFADALNAAEKDLVDAYVQGKLTGADLERFKTHYLASPLRRETVEFARAFQVFGKKSVTVGAGTIDSATRAAKQEGAGWTSVLSLFTLRLRWQWGLAAAAVILLIAGGWLVFENFRLRQQASQAQARREELLQREQELEKEIQAQRSANSASEQELARLRDEGERREQELKKAQQGGATPTSPGEGGIVSFILAPPLRGAGQVLTVSVPPGTNLVAMQLQLEAADYPVYRVALLSPANNQVLWRSGNLKPRTKGPGKVLSIRIGAGLLKPQNYVLQVSGVNAGGASEVISDYPFKVVK